MAIEQRGNSWRVRVRWKEVPHFDISFDSEPRALEIRETLKTLRGHKRFDLLRAIAEGTLDAGAMRDALMLEHGILRATVENVREFQQGRGLLVTASDDDSPYSNGVAPSRTLGALRDEWFQEMRSGHALSKRRKSYSKGTIKRYENSWAALMAWDATLAGESPSVVTDALLRDFRVAREAAGAEGTSVNRDLDALAALLTWIAARHPEAAPQTRPNFAKLKVREAAPEERWMPPERRSLWREKLRELHEDWWPLFSLVLNCGLRIDEAQGAERRDVVLIGGEPVEIKVVEREDRPLKTPSSARSVGIPVGIRPLVAAQLALPGRPEDRLFEFPYSDYQRAYGVFTTTCVKAGLHDGGAEHVEREEERLEAAVAAGSLSQSDADEAMAKLKRRPILKSLYTPHSLRHTFGVALAQADLSPQQIKELMGHQSVVNSERYMIWARSAVERADAADRVGRVLAME